MTLFKDLTPPVSAAIAKSSASPRLGSQKHIDFALASPYGGGRPGCVKRKRAAATAKEEEEEGGDEEDEGWALVCDEVEEASKKFVPCAVASCGCNTYNILLCVCTCTSFFLVFFFFVSRLESKRQKMR